MKRKVRNWPCETIKGLLFLHWKAGAVILSLHWKSFSIKLFLLEERECRKCKTEIVDKPHVSYNQKQETPVG